MDPWWMYALVFLFGYATCRTFYFIRASRLSLSLLVYSQVIYLSSMVKILESLLHTKYFVAALRVSAKEMSPICNDIDQKVDNETWSFRIYSLRQ